MMLGRILVFLLVLFVIDFRLGLFFSIGAFTCFFGYGVLWLAVSQLVQSLPYWLLWLALAVATNSSTWLAAAVLVTNMRNFPITRGIVAGILKGYTGLSVAVYTKIYSAVFHSSSSKLLLFLTLGIPILCVALMYFVRPCTPASGVDSAEYGHFVFTQVASITLGLYLLTTTVLNDTPLLVHSNFLCICCYYGSPSRGSTCHPRENDF